MIDILIFILATMIKLVHKYPIVDANGCTYTMLLRHYDRSSRDQLDKTDVYLPGVAKFVRGPPTSVLARWHLHKRHILKQLISQLF